MIFGNWEILSMMKGKEGNPIAELPYGKNALRFTLPPSVEADWILPNAAAGKGGDGNGGLPPAERIRRVLMHPIGSLPLRELARGRRNAVILISDGSRLCPSPLFLGLLLDELNVGGIPDDQIAIVVALGMHRKHTEAELRELAGEEAYRRVPVRNHSPRLEDCVEAGQTSRGTPVWINRHVAEADLRIATGNLEPHRLAGVSGGLKALVPGVAAHCTIEANHSLSQRSPGIAGDPNSIVRADLEEAQAFVPVHFLLNVLVNPARDVLEVFGGDVIQAHRAATEAVRASFLTEVDRTYPLVIASAGGAPKDTQLYQAVKTLQNAAALAAPGGAIVLVAECSEHFGNGLFQYWVETAGSRAEIVNRLQRQFTLGPHKIEHLDKVLQKHDVYLFSSMPQAMVELTGLKPVTAALSAALPDWISRYGGPIAVMPYGALTFPVVRMTERSNLHALEPLVP